MDRCEFGDLELELLMRTGCQGTCRPERNLFSPVAQAGKAELRLVIAGSLRFSESARLQLSSFSPQLQLQQPFSYFVYFSR